MRVLRVLDEELKVKVSPTFLDKAACPAALKYEYVDGHERTFSIPAERGSAAHAAIADLTTICIKEECQPKDLSDEQVHKAVDDNSDHRLYDELPDILQWVMLWRDRYLLSKYIVGQEERMSIDEYFNECDWEEAAYRGIVDVIDIKGTHCKITDYKSQPHVLSQTDLDMHRQLTFYAWLVSKFYSFVETFELRIWYLRYGFYATTPRSKQQLEAFEQGLLLQVDKIMSIDNWDPIPGSYCKWCDHTDKCPIGQPDEEGNYEAIPKAIINEEQAKHYGSELRVLEQRRKKLSDAIRKYVKGREDPVMVASNFAFGYKASPTTFYPPEEVLQVLRKHGVDASDYATFSATAMKKLLKSSEKDHPALFHDLEAIAVNKTRTQFDGYEVK